MAGGVVACGFLAVAAAVVLTSDPPGVPPPVGVWLAAVSVLLVALVGTYYGILWYRILPYAPGTRRGRWWLTGAFAVFAVLDRWWLTGTVVAAVLPAAFVVVCGVWLFRVAARRLGGSPYWAVRRVPDAVVTVAMAYALAVLFNPAATLTALPAAGLLFPVAVAAAFRVRRALAASGRLVVRAGADVVLSLLLGLAVTLFVVWAAKLLRLTRTEVGAVRGALVHVGSLADLPWPVWPALYVLLAVAAYALPYRRTLAGVARGAVTGQRTLGVVHVALMLVVFIGGAVPAAVEWSLRGPVRVAYAAALQRERDAAGARAAYAEIRRAFAARPDTEVLSAVVARIHRLSPPPAGSAGATATERHLARRLGRLQGGTRPGGRERVTVPDPPARGARDLADRLARLDRQRDRADQRTEPRRLAADLAGRAVAELVSAPELGRNEVGEIVREYLAGLVEESPLKRAFYAWTAHRPGATRPDAVRAVVPAPFRLWKAASTDLKHQLNAALPERPMPPVTAEHPLDRAVQMADQSRYLAERTAPCRSCPSPKHLSQQRADGRIDHGTGNGTSPIHPGPFDID